MNNRVGFGSRNYMSSLAIELARLGSPSYTSLQDWMNNTQAAGFFYGGDFTDNGDGSMTVAAGSGYFKISNSGIASTVSFDWPENSSVSLVDNSTNYIGVEYNGGSPQVFSSTTKDANGRTSFYLGKVFREGTSLHFLEAGQDVSEILKRVQSRLTSVDGEVVVASGLTPSEIGERYLGVSAGVMYAGLTKE